MCYEGGFACAHAGEQSALWIPAVTTNHSYVVVWKTLRGGLGVDHPGQDAREGLEGALCKIGLVDDTACVSQHTLNTCDQWHTLNLPTSITSP